MANTDETTSRVLAGQDRAIEVKDFSISLFQAFQRTGPFLPENPKAKETTDGLFKAFSRLFSDSGAMNYYIREKDEKEEVFLEGTPEGVLPLSKVMTKGVANIYVTKLLDLFRQKNMVSLCVCAGIGEMEFSNFLTLMGEEKFAEIGDERSKNIFLKTLADRGITSVSVLFREDLIVSEREIPWRVCLALSRFLKELSLLSAIRKLSGEELQKTAIETLLGALRPLATPELAYAFIMNLDLADNSVLSLKDCEAAAFRLLDQSVLNSVVPLFIENAARSREEITTALDPDKLSRIQDLLTKRLIEIDNFPSRDSLQDLYNAGLISIDGFPPRLREQIAIRKLVKSFMDYSDKYLKHLDSARTAEEYASRARPLALIVPHLMEGRKYEEALSISELLFSHTEAKGKKEIAEQALSEIAQGTALAEATKAFMTVSKESRIVLGQFFTLLDTWSVSHLIKIIRETDDLWRRKQACEILLGMGPEPAEFLVSLVEGDDLTPEAVSTVLKVLATTVDKNLASIVTAAAKKHLKSKDAQVRHDALNALTLTAPRQSYDQFESMLNDPEPDVVREALRGLGLTGDKKALMHLTDVILTAESSDDEGAWDLATAAVFSLGQLFDANHQTRSEIEPFITDLAERGFEPGLLKRVIKKSEKFPPKAMAALATLLGRFKGEKSMKLLAMMAKSGNESVARKASDELKKLASF